MSIVIGTLPYLSAKPLTRWFTHTEEGAASGIEVTTALPSNLARMLADGEIAAALVSSFEFFRTPGYVIVPGISISGQGDIESARAFSKLPWRVTQTIALDSSSLTCAAFLKILLAEQFDAYPAFVSHPPEFGSMLQVADAGLLIGDSGMLFDDRGLNVLDLGRAWRRLTRLPFVYAMWMGRAGDLTPRLIRFLKTAQGWGRTQFEPIVQEQAGEKRRSQEAYQRYLTDVMDYDLGEEHRQALETFGAKAYANGLLPELPGPVQIASV